MTVAAVTCNHVRNEIFVAWSIQQSDHLLFCDKARLCYIHSNTSAPAKKNKSLVLNEL